MLAVNGMDVRNNFKEWCNKAVPGEIIIVSRPQNENVVIVSEQEYNESQKAKRNAEYFAKLDRSFEQLERGKVIVKSMDELEAMTNE